VDDAELVRRQQVSHRAFYALLGRAPGHELLELPGVQAAIVPAAPDRSMPNAVVYEEVDALLDAHPRLVEAYAEAGVRAWTVWTPPGDEAVGRRLEALAHVHDGHPPLMAAALADVDRVPRRELRLDPAPSWREVGRLNDIAYELRGAPLETALAPLPADAAHVLVARAGGAAVACCVVLVCEADAYVCFVAVDPAARGRGLCSELQRRGLARAAEDGATSTTLEASAMGAPIYAAMGYRSIGLMGMWERRVRDNSARAG
jgi:ribosomal protein S18 acetylase RimI-like enzyme